MDDDEYIEDEYEAEGKEKNVYSKKARDELVENDEISAEEEGFMAGYESDEEEGPDDDVDDDEDKD